MSLEMTARTKVGRNTSKDGGEADLPPYLKLAWSSGILDGQKRRPKMLLYLVDSSEQVALRLLPSRTI